MTAWDDLRDDEPGESLPPEDVSANAPETHDAYFVVPSYWFPLPIVATGKLAVFAPEVAATAHEHAEGDEELQSRIFTMAGLPPDQAYVIDLDEMARVLRMPPRP